MERAPYEKNKKTDRGILFVSNRRLHDREEVSVPLGYVGSGWGPLCALGSVSTSSMVKMETGGMTAEAGGGGRFPSP